MMVAEPPGGKNMRIGYGRCRDCGWEEPIEIMVSGLCSSCAHERVDVLARYQREYQAAVDAGDPAAAAAVSEIIAAYEQKERVRLKAARREIRGQL